MGFPLNGGQSGNVRLQVGENRQWLLKNSIAPAFGRKRRARVPNKRRFRNGDTFTIILDYQEQTFSTPTGNDTAILTGQIKGPDT